MKLRTYNVDISQENKMVNALQIIDRQLKDLQTLLRKMFLSKKNKKEIHVMKYCKKIFGLKPSAYK